MVTCYGGVSQCNRVCSFGLCVTDTERRRTVLSVSNILSLKFGVLRARDLGIVCSGINKSESGRVRRPSSVIAGPALLTRPAEVGRVGSVCCHSSGSCSSP